MKKLLLLLCAFVASVSGAWGQEPTNLAEGASVTLGDSENYEQTINSGKLDNVTDGDAATSLQMHYISKTSTALIIDLGSTKTFNAVVLHQTGDRNVTSFSLSYSDDGTSWSEPEVIPNVIPGKFAANLTNSVTKRYVKYVSTKENKNNADEWGEGIAEIQLYNLTSALAFESITLTAPTTTTAVGGSSITFTAQGNANQLGAIWPLGEITWVSTTPTVATIANGVLTPVSAGTTSITATSGEITSNAIAITVNAAIPNIPTSVGTNKKGIFSTELGNTAGYGFQDWGGGNGLATTVNGTAAYQINNFKWFGSGFDKIDATTYEKLHLDIYPSFTGTLTIVPINRNATDDGNEVEKGTQFSVTAETWNSLELSIADLIDNDGLSMERLYQIKYVSTVVKNAKGVTDGFVNGDGTGSFIVGNVYLYGTASTDTESPVMTKAVVASVGASTATLTVSATDNRSALTYTVKQGETVVGSGSGTQGADATVIISGLIAETTYAVGTFTVIATDAAGNVSSAYNVPEFTTTAKPMAGDYSTTMYGSSSDAVNGKVINYTCTFAQTGMNVTVTFTYSTPEAIPGLVQYDVTATGGAKVTTDSYQWTSCTVGQVLQAHSSWAADNGGVAESKEFYYTVAGSDAGLMKLPADANGINEVLGTGSITADAFKALTTTEEKAYDLRNLKVTSAVTLVSENPNAVFIVKDAAQKTNLAGTKNMVIWNADESRYEGAIEIVDQNNANTFATNLPIYATTVSYTRNVAADKYVTIALPFTPSSTTTGFSAYAVDGDVTAGQINFQKTTSGMTAGTAYMLHNTLDAATDFVASASGVDLDFTEGTSGVFRSVFNAKSLTETDNAYILSDGKFKHAVGASIGGFRGYIYYAVAGSRDLEIMIDGNVTGINDVKSKMQEGHGVLYNLQGQEVKNPSKGIYIMNGKKFIKK